MEENDWVQVLCWGMWGVCASLRSSAHAEKVVGRESSELTVAASQLVDVLPVPDMDGLLMISPNLPLSCTCQGPLSLIAKTSGSHALRSHDWLVKSQELPT